MILVKPNFEIIAIMGCSSVLTGRESLRLIELAGRTCYKSEDKITEGSAEKFVRMVIRKGLTE